MPFELRPIPTGFSPLDDILNGGIRAGELLMIGGAFGVGKTIWALQVARNAVLSDPGVRALYICYELVLLRRLNRAEQLGLNIFQCTA